MKVLLAGAFATVALVLVLAGGQAGGQEKPKYKIAEVMAKAMKGGLKDKVEKGTASAEEKETFIELITALHQNMPPKGKDEAWKTRTQAILDAAKAGDGAALKKAANCQACHSEHKGKAK